MRVGMIDNWRTTLALGAMFVIAYGGTRGVKWLYFNGHWPAAAWTALGVDIVALVVAVIVGKIIHDSEPVRSGSDDRGEVQLTDVVVGTFVLIALISVAPFFYTFTGMASGSADPFSALLMQLIVPFLFIALLVSLGVSAST